MASILILKTGSTIPEIVDTLGDFEGWIMAGMNIPEDCFKTVAVYEGEPLPAIKDISAIVITGSPAMVTDDLPWIKASEHLVRSAIAAQIPVLGICFGHQLLAQALGGRVDYNPIGREIGTVSIGMTPDAADDALFGQLPETMSVHVTHMQSVMSLPEGARVLASNDFDPHQGVRYAEKAWGMQFHPEFDAPIMAAYIRARTTQIQAEGLDAGQLLGEVKQAPDSWSLLQRFANIIA